MSRYTPRQAVPTKGRSKTKPVVEFGEFNGNLSGMDLAHWAGGYLKGGSQGYQIVIPQTNAPDVRVAPWEIIVKDQDGDIHIYDHDQFGVLYTIIDPEEAK